MSRYRLSCCDLKQSVTDFYMLPIPAPFCYSLPLSSSLDITFNKCIVVVNYSLGYSHTQCPPDITTAQIRPKNGSIALNYSQKCNNINLQCADPQDVCCWYKPTISACYHSKCLCDTTTSDLALYALKMVFYGQGPASSREDIPSKQVPPPHYHSKI